MASTLFGIFILGYLTFQDKGRQRINLLILGESGPGHVGAPLSDMIILSSFSKTGSVFISVPRDLWYTPWQTKINAVYFYGEKKGDGFFYTKQIMEEILGEKIDRVLIVDFEAFKEMVNLVGGIEVNVERSFDDFFYPIAGKENDLCQGDPQFRCRYEHLHFEAGLQHMDGERALKFVRSRYAQGEEGTDQARSYRQQKVLQALKDKTISPSIFLSRQKIIGLWQIFQKRIKSDLLRDDFISLGKILVFSKARNFSTFVLDGWQDGEGLFYNPKKYPSGQWVLVPKDPTWKETHRFIDCLIEKADKSLCFGGVFD